MGCNCNKRKIEEFSKYSDEGKLNIDKSFSRKVKDFLSTLAFRIFGFITIIIMGLIVIPWSSFKFLFVGNNDIAFDITKLFIRKKKRVEKDE